MMKKTPPTIWTNPIHFIACGFGVGALPFAPGTFGTVVGVGLYLLIRPLPLMGYLLITLALNLLGIWLCGKFNRDIGCKDHPAACWDEIAAFPIVMIAVPFTWYWLVLGFGLFRLFDIWKPFPIRWVDQHVPGGFGVMLDDVLAALASLTILQLLVFIAH